MALHRLMTSNCQVGRVGDHLGHVGHAGIVRMGLPIGLGTPPIASHIGSWPAKIAAVSAIPAAVGASHAGLLQWAVRTQLGCPACAELHDLTHGSMRLKMTHIICTDRLSVSPHSLLNSIGYFGWTVRVPLSCTFGYLPDAASRRVDRPVQTWQPS